MSRYEVLTAPTPIGWVIWVIIVIIALLPLIGIGMGIYQAHMEKKAQKEASEKAKQEAYDEIQRRKL